jgi:hypothetical protein
MYARWIHEVSSNNFDVQAQSPDAEVSEAAGRGHSRTIARTAVAVEEELREEAVSPAVNGTSLEHSADAIKSDALEPSTNGTSDAHPVPHEG